MVTIHELARIYGVLPYEIKQLPWVEVKEMIEMLNLKSKFSDTGDS